MKIKNLLTKLLWNLKTDAQKRIAIAKDVILQLKAHKYLANKGVYIEKVDEDDIWSTPSSGDIQSQFDQIKECRVCAIGATILSCTKFANTLNFEDVGGALEMIYNSKVKSLLSIFSANQLMLIECAFEGGTGGERFGRCEGAKLSYEEVSKCDSFFNNLWDASDRLEAIMQNIIDNKGTFVL